MTTPEQLPDPWPAPFATRPCDVEVSLPGSKSITNRALVLAALAEGPSVVRQALRSRDTLLMAQALTALGSPVDTTTEDWKVAPGRLRGGASVDCGLAGTVARFVPPVAALADGPTAFDGDPHMRRRPVAEVLTALRGLGVRVDDEDRGTLPFTVHGQGRVAGGPVTLDASASSQFISALLLVGARFDQGVQVTHQGPPVPSQPHIRMTVSMLREHGVEVDESTPDRWTVRPGPVQALDRTVEPDLSNAAPFLALAAVTGGRVAVRDWPTSTTQPGDRLREVLERMGCTVEHSGSHLVVTGPPRTAGGLQGVDLDMHDVGELVPAVAALCALARTPSHLRGVAHIRGHETDRLAALTRELRGLGADVTEHEDGLSIDPAPLHGGVFHTYADHRMAHAGVVLGAAVEGVLVEDVATTSKTFTDFPGHWSRLFGSDTQR